MLTGLLALWRAGMGALIQPVVEFCSKWPQLYACIRMPFFCCAGPSHKMTSQSEQTSTSDKRILRSRTGPNAPNWKGGVTTQYGYRLAKAWNHPRANKYTGYVREHILAYEKFHNCCVLPWAVIHHKKILKKRKRRRRLNLRVLAVT